MRRESKTLLVTAALILPLALTACKKADIMASTTSAPAVSVTAADYEAANKLLESNTKGLVKNQGVDPHWLGTTGKFWYQRETATGSEYVVVDSSGVKTPAFDHSAVATALTAALASEVSAENLGLSSTSMADDLSRLKGIAGGKQVNCDLTAYSCSASDITPPAPGLLPSPGGKWAATTRDDNLILIDLASGEERQLTTDGAPYYSYGKLPDSALITVQIAKTGMKLPPFSSTFSPDERFLIVHRVDERAADVNPFVEWVPTDGSLRPKVYNVRSQFTGDRNVVNSDLFVFDTNTGKQVKIEKPAGYDAATLDGSILGWSLKRNQAFMTLQTHGSKKMALVRIDLNTGKSTVVIEESGETRVTPNSYIYNAPNIRILNDGDEVIWFSDRGGFGHLYLYDAQTGKQKARITGGNWLVQDIHQIDEARREVYFTAGGREAGRDPYLRHLYKAPFDGGEVTLLTDVNADHHFAPEPVPMFAMLFGIVPGENPIQPAHGILIDTYSTVDQPPVTVLRSTEDGSVVAELETADASALYAAGYKAPVRKAIKAADGVTDVWSVYYAPQKELPNGKHPVVDAVYGGPQVIVAPRNFIEAYSGSNPLMKSALTKLGFGVVVTDGRGTPLRSNEFRDAGYTEFTQVGIDDHIAAIKQWAVENPELDTSRVGIHGWSWGGTFTAQAMLSRPEFYDVGLTGAGVYDYAALYPGFENMTGVPVYKDGSIYRSSPDEKPANWDKLDITAMAENLQGKMMIIYGDMDENVPPSQAFRLVDALVKANKPYDLLHLPNQTHSSALLNPFTIQRHLDYYVEHLLGMEPPAGYSINLK
ncbi:prolyl oligopeptidase family serine peptidase [Pseudomaricurvus alkylphenolicus]|uniref:S9 family peptidase n=1 Tax=Pseudomaricurvus alkylphenolicus TaxID=1306991 RepID=UPI0014215ED7|nr:prolyl oligopeptidase family serine peptidase [Pseudomaricurvus alkylphenolicus]NIB45226.1 prolyl oligopeptidase family serine peptidase [Pseudomaricurvus alkylphenolicus]